MRALFRHAVILPLLLIPLAADYVLNKDCSQDGGNGPSSGPCNHVALATINDNIWLVVRIAAGQSNTLEVAVTSPKATGMLDFPNRLDHSRLLGKDCRYTDDRLEAVYDVRVLYVMCRCGQEVVAMTRTAVINDGASFTSLPMPLVYLGKSPVRLSFAKFVARQEVDTKAKNIWILSPLRGAMKAHLMYAYNGSTDSIKQYSPYHRYIAYNSVVSTEKSALEMSLMVYTGNTVACTKAFVKNDVFEIIKNSGGEKNAALWAANPKRLLAGGPIKKKEPNFDPIPDGEEEEPDYIIEPANHDNLCPTPEIQKVKWCAAAMSDDKRLTKILYGLIAVQLVMFVMSVGGLIVYRVMEKRRRRRRRFETVAYTAYETMGGHTAKIKDKKGKKGKTTTKGKKTKKSKAKGLKFSSAAAKKKKSTAGTKAKTAKPSRPSGTMPKNGSSDTHYYTDSRALKRRK